MIELTGVVQSYPGKDGPIQALKGIDLQVQAGEIFGVIGRSGAGKSSLIRTVNLLNRPSAGRVRVAGQDLMALSAAELRAARRQIGMVFQHFNLLASRTVYDNIALPLELEGLPADEIRRRVEPLIDLVGLSAQRDRHPAQISGGQKQRVGIARALASRPQVLLCDEATSALDPETARSILALLRQINRDFQLTVLLITHQMQVIKQLAHRVAVLDAGEIVEIGPVMQVFTAPQHPITRSLLDDVVPQQLPEPVLERLRELMRQTPAPAGEVWRLSFAGESSDHPLLTELIRRFGLELNIVFGQVDEIQGEPYGAFALFVRGADRQRVEAKNYLSSVGVHVEALADVR